MAMQYRVVIVLALILFVSLAVTRTVGGEVPTAADFAACNEGAPHEVKAGTASPIMGDHLQAESARASAVTPRNNIAGCTGPM